MGAQGWAIAALWLPLAVAAPPSAPTATELVAAFNAGITSFDDQLSSCSGPAGAKDAPDATIDCRLGDTGSVIITTSGGRVSYLGVYEPERGNAAAKFMITARRLMALVQGSAPDDEAMERRLRIAEGQPGTAVAWTESGQHHRLEFSAMHRWSFTVDLGASAGR